MSKRSLEDFLNNGEYLPYFLEDFHDAKDVFKYLQTIVQNRNDGYTSDMNWVMAHVYTIDIFLYVMARYGYTLQRSRKQVEFEPIGNLFEQIQQKNDANLAELIKGLMNKKSS